MSLSPGTLLDSCEVLDLIGKGGMGEVYRARDRKLGRYVAIKALPASFTVDPERLARFQREAQILAVLNHPNLAIIHELKELQGAKYLILELVEGETLAERLARGPIPIDEALAIAHQIAEGLQAAHDKGIVHRDLKPANVKITPEGRVKILDFGLAKNDNVSGPSDASNSPTLSAMQTQAGIIMGTAAYMSPEQARGKTMDRRSDVWSFGAVFYEMLTGRQAFPNGETVSDTLAGILKGEPDLKSLPADAPPRIAALLARCLRKDLRRRVPDIAVARIEIEEVLNEPAKKSDEAAAMSLLKYVWPAIAIASLLLAVVLTILASSQPAPDPYVVYADLSVPARGSLFLGQPLSPDGRKVAFVASSQGASQIWIRWLDSPDAKPLAGTEGSGRVAWSPDSRHLAFFAGGKLKKVAIESGRVDAIANETGRDLAWGESDVLLIGRQGKGLMQVPASGGAAQPATELMDGETIHDYPDFLPGGRRFLYLARRGSAPKDWDVYVGSLDSKERYLVPGIHAGARYSPSGHLLFNREGGATLVAQPFDAAKLKLTGEAFTIAEETAGGVAWATFSASTNGSIAYLGVALARETIPTWFDQNGRQLGAAGPEGEYRNLALSPNNKFIAFDRETPRDVYVLDLKTGLISRFTTNAAADGVPVWSPTSDIIAFSSSRNTAANVGERNIAGGNLYVAPYGVVGKETRLSTSNSGQFPMDWSTDGHLVYTMEGDIWALKPPGNDAPIPITETPFEESQPRVSPDGRWIAYTSLKSGTPEVIIRSFLNPGIEKQVSNGGSLPRWSSDSTELFYLSPNTESEMMSVKLKPAGSELELTPPRSLFKTRMQSTSEYRSYDVASDGRFLINVPTAGEAVIPITVIHNWAAGLRK